MSQEQLLAQLDSAVDTLLSSIDVDAINYGNGSYTIPHGSASVMVAVRPMGDSEAALEITSHVVTGASVSKELMQFLLRKNAELHFGAFGLLFDDTVIFSYTLPSAVVTKESLATALSAVAAIADYYDDEIVAIAGGHRAADVTSLDDTP